LSPSLPITCSPWTSSSSHAGSWSSAMFLAQKLTRELLLVCLQRPRARRVPSSPAPSLQHSSPASAPRTASSSASPMSKPSLLFSLVKKVCVGRIPDSICSLTGWFLCFQQSEILGSNPT
jgi:hypothetical protein